MEKNKARIITGSSSIFLDVLRIVAALTVFYIHAFVKWFPFQAHNRFKAGEPSHAAVIVFFVLSGYVIAHTTISNNRGSWQYAHARLSRLSSIVIPALVLTAFVQFIVGYVNPAMLWHYSKGLKSLYGFRYILSGLFINEFWFYSAAPALDRSLWSLSFEFWYYAIFGLWFYRASGWKSVIIPIAACLIAGPKILVMMPIWLLGYWAYRLPRPVMSTTIAWLGVAGFLLLGLIALETIPPYPYPIGHKPLYYADQFLTDWAMGIFVAAALWILPTGDMFGSQSNWTGLIRKMADLTFPLYVLHYPLFILYTCLVNYREKDATQLWEAIVVVFVASVLIGLLLEKQRPLWGRFFKWLLNYIKALFRLKKLNTYHEQ